MCTEISLCHAAHRRYGTAQVQDALLLHPCTLGASVARAPQRTPRSFSSAPTQSQHPALCHDPGRPAHRARVERTPRSLSSAPTWKPAASPARLPALRKLPAASATRSTSGSTAQRRTCTRPGRFNARGQADVVFGPCAGPEAHGTC